MVAADTSLDVWQFLLQQAPVVVLLVLILVAGAKKWWVWGWVYDAKSKEADEWKRVALGGTGLAEKATDHASQVTDVAERIARALEAEAEMLRRQRPP